MREKSIEINSISVNNRNMTLSVFKQIHIENAFNEYGNFIGDKWFGYIHYKGEWLLYINKGELRRCNLNMLRDIIKESGEQDGIRTPPIEYSTSLSISSEPLLLDLWFEYADLSCIHHLKNTMRCCLPKLQGSEIVVIVNNPLQGGLLLNYKNSIIEYINKAMNKHFTLIISLNNNQITEKTSTTKVDKNAVNKMLCDIIKNQIFIAL